MEQTLLLCISDSAYLEELRSCAQAVGFRAEKRSALPRVDEFEAVFPDILLVDNNFIVERGPSFLEEVSSRFPAIQTYVLASSEYSEEVLFSSLKSGARGWVFKENCAEVVRELSRLAEEKHFLKPFVAQLVLEEFRKFPEGEMLLPIEEEILRQCARGVSTAQIEKDLNFSSKFLHRHWEDIWQKLNINARAQKQIVDRAPLFEGPPAEAAEKLPLPPEAASKAEEERLNLVTFCVGREEFAFSLTDLQEIQRMMPITPLPRVPSYVVGIANLRGTIVPIIDLRIKLGMDLTPLTKETRIILVHVERKLVGILVDSVKQVLRVQPSQLEPPPALALPRGLKSIKAVLSIDDRLILVLDLKMILLEDEEKTKRSFQLAGR